jgi:uncharacterized membrane protein
VKRFEEQTTVNAPPNAVYDYVSDFTRHGEWGGHGLEVTADGDGPAAVGATYSTTAKLFGTQREHSTLTEVEPNNVFGWDSKGALGIVHHRFTMSGGDGSTSVTKSAEFTQPSFLAKVTSWRLAKDVPAGLRSDLQNIKTHLDSSGAGS